MRLATVASLLLQPLHQSTASSRRTPTMYPGTLSTPGTTSRHRGVGMPYLIDLARWHTCRVLRATTPCAPRRYWMGPSIQVSGIGWNSMRCLLRDRCWRPALVDDVAEVDEVLARASGHPPLEVEAVESHTSTSPGLICKVVAAHEHCRTFRCDHAADVDWLPGSVIPDHRKHRPHCPPRDGFPVAGLLRPIPALGSRDQPECF